MLTQTLYSSFCLIKNILAVGILLFYFFFFFFCVLVVVLAGLCFFPCIWSLFHAIAVCSIFIDDASCLFPFGLKVI